MKALSNLRIAWRLGLVVTIAMLGVCVAGVQAMRLMKEEMLNARMAQIHAQVEMTRSMAKGLQSLVGAGKMSKQQAIDEFARRAQTMTYDGGSGYMFAYTMDGAAIVFPEPSLIGTNRLDSVTNGRYIARELRDGIAAAGEVNLSYEYQKPGTKELLRKVAYAVAIPEWNAFVGTGAYVDDLDAKLAPIVRSLGSSILLIAGVCSVIAWIIGSSITRPLKQLGIRMKQLAEGSVESEIPGLELRDEIGSMASTVQVFRESAVRVRLLEKEESESRLRLTDERSRAMKELADGLEASVNGIVSSVVGAAAEMETNAASMANAADGSRERIATVNSASQNAMANVQAVAGAAEELSASVAEISRQVAHSTAMAGQAVEQAKTTNSTVHMLSASAVKIGEVVRLIHAIASQTNLLALNATIEAARAGEAGRGFAVVASEVKALATQTAKATEEISTQVTAMQAATENAVIAIGDIVATIGQINEISSAISTSVVEQGSATREIAGGIQQAATGSSEIAGHMEGVHSAAAETGRASGEVLIGARYLDEQAEMLQTTVANFLQKVRAA